MSFVLSETKIKQLCGDIAFKKGKSYYEAGKVSIHDYIKNYPIVEASVRGGSLFHVTVKHDEKGEIQAECNCPPLVSIPTYCQHIAAVLLAIQEMQREESSRGSQLAKQVLGLFKNQRHRRSDVQSHFDTRKIVNVEFTCKPILKENEGYVMSIQLKAGLQELFSITQLKEFLEKVESRETYESFTGFMYNPAIHSFRKQTNAVLKELRSIVHYGEDDKIILYPSTWEHLQPLLLAEPSVLIEHNGSTYNGLQISNKTLPLEFKFEEANTAGYQLDVKGLREITILKSYGFVLFNGEIIKLFIEDCKKLAELNEMLEQTGMHQLMIPSDQLAHFMESVTPGLMKLGHVHIAMAVSEKLVKTPLKAKLFLDRVKNRLLAGLEFHYGNLVVNPFEENSELYTYNPTLSREGEKEQLILNIMNDSLFTKTDGGFYMHDEEAEYHFLHHVIPTLEKLVEIYATSAVKLRIHKGHIRPRIKVDVDDKTDWLCFTFDIKGIPESEIRELLIAIEEKRKYYKLKNGSLLSLETKEFQNLSEFIQEFSVDDLERKEKRLPLISGLKWVDSLQEGNIITESSYFQKLVEDLHNPKELDFAIPTSLDSVLRDYQKHGFRWLKMLAQYKFGGILADDMGLGKTLQSIAFIVSILPEIREHNRPVLIVAPSSLVYNWMNELNKFAPEIQACIIDGNKEKRGLTLKDLSGTDVVITSYPLLRMDAPLYRKHSFHTLFLDEAQAFKNPATQTAKAVKKIKADYRFALTGTPIENSLEELWSIFYVIFPDLLPGIKDFNKLTRAKIAKRVRPFVLRRLKKDVLKELPKKVELILPTDLNVDQKKIYAAYLAELKHDTLKHLRQGNFRKNRIKILAGLTRLRQICCHPALFVEGYDGSSGKFDQLMDIIEDCRVTGRRVLVFSQFTMMLDIIGRDLGYRGIPFFYLDGQTPSSERVHLCNKFNAGEGNLFLISLKAGGTGLNLTGADTVVLYDLWWNPAVEQQAADRAYRMGQEKEVQVIKLVARGTIEEKMNELQEKKKDLIGEVMNEGNERLSPITEQDIREILMLV